MRIGKKAMGISQVFIFIVAAITFVFIMIFGYRAITDFLSTGEEVELVQFKNHVESSIKSIYTQFGSIEQVDYRVPAGVEQVCFVDLNAPPDSDLQQENPFAYDLWQTAHDEVTANQKPYDAVDRNVFFVPHIDNPIKVHTIKITELDRDGNVVATPGYICENVNRARFSLILEGKGTHTEISPVRLTS